MTGQICSLSTASELPAVGGKARALQTMLVAGFNVPAGYVVTASVYDALTPPLEAAILRSFDALGADVVAVRSSAVQEDGQADTWAGQLDTFLNCQRTEVIQRVQDCWQSACSERAAAYARHKGVASSAVAVIIQAMIPSEVSGVAFSVHPVTQNKQHIVIEAGLGLGEAIVSGQITPDTYVIDKISGDTLEKHIARQSKKLVRGADGTTTWQDTGPHAGEQKLTDANLKELTGLTKRLELFFGYPVDVEWAIHNGTVYVLQSRPITTLTPA